MIYHMPYFRVQSSKPHYIVFLDKESFKVQTIWGFEICITCVELYNQLYKVYYTSFLKNELKYKLVWVPSLQAAII